MKIIVCGGRMFDDRPYLFECLDKLDKEIGPLEVIEGSQASVEKITLRRYGADYFAREWATLRGRKYITVRPEWIKYKKAAGPMRNKKMLEHNPAAVAAFRGGTGTQSMLDITHAENHRRMIAEDEEKPQIVIYDFRSKGRNHGE